MTTKNEELQKKREKLQREISILKSKIFSDVDDLKREVHLAFCHDLETRWGIIENLARAVANDCEKLRRRYTHLELGHIGVSWYE